MSDLRAMDVALGGQGAPIVPMGERLLLDDYALFLNLGGIANVTSHGKGGGGERGGGQGKSADEVKTAGQARGGGQGKDGGHGETWKAFDICPANRVLNMLAAKEGKAFDEGGAMAAEGHVDEALLDRLNGLDYYKREYPKSLGNEFGTDEVMPMIVEAMEKGGAGARGIGVRDALRTYVEQIAIQVREAGVGRGAGAGKEAMALSGGGGLMGHEAIRLSEGKGLPGSGAGGKMLVTGRRGA